MTDTILPNFATSLQKLLEETLAKKSDELKQREEAVAKREAKVYSILKNDHRTGRIEVQVGSITYHTTCETLRSVKDSYFTGLLHPQFYEEGSPLFIARDGELFKYVLEYLTYERLYSVVPNDGTLEKLIVDADFYLLPGLAEQAKELRSDSSKSKGPVWMRVASSRAINRSSAIYWDSATNVPPSHFTHTGSTITIEQSDLYHIYISYEQCCSTHGQGSANLDLKVNGNAVARMYHGQASAYYDGRSLEHLTLLNKGDTIEAWYFSNTNGNPNADSLGTSLTILCLSSQ